MMISIFAASFASSCCEYKLTLAKVSASSTPLYLPVNCEHGRLRLLTFMAFTGSTKKKRLCHKMSRKISSLYSVQATMALLVLLHLSNRRINLY